jgi:hypothetical protein
MVMNDRPAAMTLAEFEARADRFGADPSVWPLDRRDAARALAARNDTAQRVLRDATRLERLLDVLPAPRPSEALEARVLAMAQAETDAHWIWMLVARPVWRPALLAAAMLGGVYLGAAALPTALAVGDASFDLTTVAGGGDTLGYVDLLEE